MKDYYKKILRRGFRAYILAIGCLFLVAPVHSLAQSGIEIDALTTRAEEGDADAMDDLADAYRKGEGVERDLAKAEQLYRRAIEAGNDHSRIWLGRMLAEVGRGEEGLAVHNDAFEIGVKGSARIRGRLHVYGKYGNLSDPAFGEAELQRLVNEGDKRAAYYLANALDGGSSRLAVDEARAISLYQPLAESGNANAQYRLGRLYYQGSQTPKDPETAAKWLNLAADSGISEALFILGKVESSLGNYSAAIENFERAKANDPVAAGSALGRAHLRGEFGSASNAQTGIRELEPLSAGGHTRSTRELARFITRNKASNYKIDPGVVYSRLAEQSAATDKWSSIFLLRMLRKYPKVVNDASGARKAILEERGGVLPAGTLANERIRLAGDTLTGDALFEAIGDIVDPTLDDRDYASAMVTTYWTDKNAYTWLLQRDLRQLGYYNGPRDGLMTRQTIRAVRRYCAEVKLDDLCSAGVLRSDTAKAIAPVLAKGT